MLKKGGIRYIHTMVSSRPNQDKKKNKCIKNEREKLIYNCSIIII